MSEKSTPPAICSPAWIIRRRKQAQLRKREAESKLMRGEKHSIKTSCRLGGGRWISSLRQVQHAVNEAAHKTTSSAWSRKAARGGSSTPVPGNTGLTNMLGRALQSTLDFFKLLLQLMICVWSLRCSPSAKQQDWKCGSLQSKPPLKCLVSVTWVSRSCIQLIDFLLELTASCHPLFLTARDLHCTWPCGVPKMSPTTWLSI